MKVRELIRLLQGCDPDAGVFLDLGACHDKVRHLAHALLTGYVDAAVDIESIVIDPDDGVKEIYLLPYDEYTLASDDVVDNFFKLHGLDGLGC